MSGVRCSLRSSPSATFITLPSFDCTAHCAPAGDHARSGHYGMLRRKVSKRFQITAVNCSRFTGGARTASGESHVVPLIHFTLYFTSVRFGANLHRWISFKTRSSILHPRRSLSATRHSSASLHRSDSHS